jgi:hypothetical protein
MRLCTAALLLVAASAAAAPPLRVAILPLREAGLSGDEVQTLEHALVESVASLPNASVANLSKEGRLTAPRAALTEPQPSARAQALAREVSATRALVCDVARLGDGVVVYLQAIDPKSSQSLGSTTASLSQAHALPPADRAALRGALVRVLDPSRWVGRVTLKLDVKGAQVLVDGRPAGDFTKPIELPVGTHALRVTHPAYHDFLRFIDVPFDETVTLDVPLAAYPLAEGEMAERAKKSAPSAPPKPLPWYRRWYALAAAGVILTGLTVGIVYAARPDLPGDRSLRYSAKPVP